MLKVFLQEIINKALGVYEISKQYQISRETEAFYNIIVFLFYAQLKLKKKKKHWLINLLFQGH
jgi:hypothetical protein